MGGQRSIPIWDSYRYAGRMSTQIAVRITDELVAFLDRSVDSGKAASRAALVASALEREMRRQLAERDAELLAKAGATDELDDLVAWTATHTELSD